MAFDFETIRQAIATKALAATGIASAGTQMDVLLPRPALRLLVPVYQLVAQDQGWTERYTLTFPGEVLVDHPAGKTRSTPTVIGLMRALQIEWRRDTHLNAGLDAEWPVAGSWIESMTYGLQEFQDTGLDGFQVVWMVKVDETLSSIRTTS